MYMILVIGILSLLLYAISGDRSSGNMMSINELAEEVT